MGGPQGAAGPQGQPYYGRPYPRRQPSEFGTNLFRWFAGIFKKDPTAIFVEVGGSKSPVWLIYMAIYAFFGALTVACSIGKVVTIFDGISLMGGLDHLYHSASIKFAVAAFFGGFLFYAAAMFLTILVIWGLFTVMGKRLSFLSVCNVTMVAYVPSILAVMFSFICSFSIFSAALAGFVSAVAGVATMLLLYGAVRRLSDSGSSLIWPYVAAQAILKLLIAIVAVFLIFILAGALMVNSYRYW